MGARGARALKTEAERIQIVHMRARFVCVASNFEWRRRA